MEVTRKEGKTFRRIHRVTPGSDVVMLMSPQLWLTTSDPKQAMVLQVVEDILDDDQDMEDMNLGRRAANDQLLAVRPGLWGFMCMARGSTCVACFVSTCIPEGLLPSKSRSSGALCNKQWSLVQVGAQLPLVPRLEASHTDLHCLPDLQVTLAHAFVMWLDMGLMALPPINGVKRIGNPNSAVAWLAFGPGFKTSKKRGTSGAS